MIQLRSVSRYGSSSIVLQGCRLRLEYPRSPSRPLHRAVHVPSPSPSSLVRPLTGSARCGRARRQTNNRLQARQLSTAQDRPTPERWLLPVEESNVGLLSYCERRVQAYEQARQEIETSLDAERQKELALELKDGSALLEAWESYRNLRKALSDARPHLSDPDEALRTMFASEIEEIEAQLGLLITEILPKLILPPMSSDGLSAIMSLNIGIGGGEAARFLEEVSKMYQGYAETRGWKHEVLSSNEGPQAKGVGGNGFRELTLKFTPGETYDDQPSRCYGDLMWESGIHRVQRVPPGATVDKMHSSTINVSVSPIYPDTTDEPLFDPADVRTETMRSRGAGGQHVNKTESAVRLTHVPTGIVVSMQDSRSQHQNRAYAWEVLRARLSQRKREEEQAARQASRLDSIRDTFRGDKVRTYNFPQDRVTDHRIGFTTSGIQAILAGPDFSRMVDSLRADFDERRLKNLMAGGQDLLD